MSRNRNDVVSAAGRLFAQRGYHGTSMRDLGAELGLQGSSLYSHISSKEDLLVEVVERASDLFGASSARAIESSDDPAEQLRALIDGHVSVVLDHLDTARTFLNEARALDRDHRQRVVKARDNYEHSFRDVIRRGRDSGTFRSGIDPTVYAILILSILNAIDRWFSADGRLSRNDLVDEIYAFVMAGLG